MDRATVGSELYSGASRAIIVSRTFSTRLIAGRQRTPGNIDALDASIKGTFVFVGRPGAIHDISIRAAYFHIDCSVSESEISARVTNTLKALHEIIAGA